MPVLCSSKCGAKAILKRPKTGDALCKVCGPHSEDGDGD